MLLRHYLERGLNKAEIARELGVSRRTVYNWIDGGQLNRDLDNAAVQYTGRARRLRARSMYSGRSSRPGWPSFPG